MHAHHTYCTVRSGVAVKAAPITEAYRVLTGEIFPVGTNLQIGGLILCSKMSKHPWINCQNPTATLSCTCV